MPSRVSSSWFALFGGVEELLIISVQIRNVSGTRLDNLQQITRTVTF
jgi:hypothetical protein